MAVVDAVFFRTSAYALRPVSSSWRRLPARKSRASLRSDDGLFVVALFILKTLRNTVR